VYCIREGFVPASSVSQQQQKSAVRSLKPKQHEPLANPPQPCRNNAANTISGASSIREDRLDTVSILSFYYSTVLATMTITFKKAGETLATKVVQSATKAAPKAAAAVAPTVEVGNTRAVTKEEAPFVKPSAVSHTESMMPWRGWVDRFLQDKLAKDKYDLLYKTLYFLPNDPYQLLQIPMASAKVPISNDGEMASFREVSPGSQPPVRVPLDDLDADPYDSGYFKRDTRRRYVDPEFPHPDIEKIKLDMQDPNDPEVQAAKEKLAAGPKSSKGNKGVFPTGKSDFDPSGLRANMSVSPAALSASLDTYMPNHVS
jgi:hypothetical protein